MEIQSDFRELLELFNEYKVEIFRKYIGLNEFVINKRVVGRKKDLSDLEALAKD